MRRTVLIVLRRAIRYLDPIPTVTDIDVEMKLDGAAIYKAVQEESWKRKRRYGDTGLA